MMVSVVDYVCCKCGSLIRVEGSEEKKVYCYNCNNFPMQICGYSIFEKND